jgi:hypothetical protein
VLTVVLVFVLGAGVVLSGRAPATAQKGPVKIGFVVPLGGPLAANGKDTVNGLQMFLDEHGSRLGGREVKLILEDDEGKPATGLTKARSLVESQGVHLLVGSISAAIGYARSPYIEARKIPSLYPIVLTALRQVDLADAPRGPINLDDFGNPVQNVYVRKVEKVNGRLQNTVIHTFPNVSQFWTYKPDEFLKAPVYSRDYPPCKHCS